MALVYLIAVPEDAANGEEIAAILKQRGHMVRADYGKFGFPPARPREITLALWSRAAMMSPKRMMMTNRAIDAWEAETLVMAKLDHGLAPHGLSDFEMVDLTFEGARQHRIGDIANMIREMDMAAAQRRAAPAPPAAESVMDGPDIFISYAHADSAAVYPIVDIVEEAGKSVWIDKEGMQAGQSWAGMIVRAIKSADTVCLMCSERAFASNHVRREVYLADKYKKGLLPVRLDDSEMPEDIEYFLIDRQWVDLVDVPPAEHRRHLKAAFD